MQALRYRPAAHLEAKPYSSTNLMPAKRRRAAAAISGLPAFCTSSSGPTLCTSLNWSGVANTNSLTGWDTVHNTSFNMINSVWNVPVAQPPFGACAAGITGATGAPGFYEVSWNGIDGVSEGTSVLQGGSLSYTDCGGPAGPATTLYFGWVEWYPSNPTILEIDCTYGNDINVPCVVNAGDWFLVITYGANSTLQHVFVEDATQGWSATYELTQAPGTPALVGSSEEQIVERPCCDTDGYPLALNNYLADFFDYANGTDVAGDSFFVGDQTPATWIFTMYPDDGGDLAISGVEQGSAGYQGLNSIFFESENCAYSGGCASQ
jgi:hypothetical protein